MLFRVSPQTDGMHLYTEPHSRYRLPYYTVKEMQKKYPDGNFVIVGEIGGFALSPTDGDQLLLEDGSMLYILPRGSLKKIFEWITGYIEVEKDTYIAVVGSLFPSFLRRR